jgi:hypothetical protein
VIAVAMGYSTADPRLAALSNLIGAEESESDAATLTLKGTGLRMESEAGSALGLS